MKIRSKMIVLVLPLLATPLILAGIVSVLSARNSITAVATQFLRFKAEGVIDYADGQWRLLEQSGMSGRDSFVHAAKSAVESFARNAVRSETELIFAVNDDGELGMTSNARLTQAFSAQELSELAGRRSTGWTVLSLGGVVRVAHVARFDPFSWNVLVTERRDTFYAATNRIAYNLATILAGSLIAASLLLFVFALYLTRPIQNMADTMAGIIRTRDMSKRVDVVYNDETGRLGHTFNLMLGELDKAYDHIKTYALRAAVAKVKEQKIRNIFQKYVPKGVIDRFFENPESMLVGEDRELAVLFSDIRGFTTLSENMAPDQVVESLNQYFSMMVDVIVSYDGIVDKYIGDAIMAFFGAPVQRDDDIRRSVLAALDMADALKDFNTWQRQRERPSFTVGMGLNYGPVTVGNIGSEKKMDYTVIGDMVNVASRLEGLTKVYKQQLIVSEPVAKVVQEEIPCRLLDHTVVRGRSQAGGIYAVKRKLSAEEAEAWEEHSTGMQLYYGKSFSEAAEHFELARRLLREDRPAEMMLERCRQLMQDAPPAGWTGAIVMEEK